MAEYYIKNLENYLKDNAGAKVGTIRYESVPRVVDIFSLQGAFMSGLLYTKCVEDEKVFYVPIESSSRLAAEHLKGGVFVKTLIPNNIHLDNNGSFLTLPDYIDEIAESFDVDMTIRQLLGSYTDLSSQRELLNIFQWIVNVSNSSLKIE